jgi:hypothetical protein
MQTDLKTWQWADSRRLQSLISEGGEELTSAVSQGIEIADEFKEHLENDGEIQGDDNEKVNEYLQEKADFYEAGDDMDDFSKASFYHEVAKGVANIISGGKFKFGDLTIATQLIHDANNVAPKAETMGLPKE